MLSGDYTTHTHTHSHTHSQDVAFVAISAFVFIVFIIYVSAIYACALFIIVYAIIFCIFKATLLTVKRIQRILNLKDLQQHNNVTSFIYLKFVRITIKSILKCIYHFCLHCKNTRTVVLRVISNIIIWDYWYVDLI